MNGCNDRVRELAPHLGGVHCDSPSAFAYVHNPLHLVHWTLNVIELLILAGALMALVHAWRWYRTHRDPTMLGVWLAALIYLLMIEPPLYFPERFGLTRIFQVIFIHNEFTMGFLYNRLPLYIVALYPALLYFAYTLVRQAGVFERRGLLVGAMCVGFVHHVFYEVFDHLGPQLRWWLWDYQLPFANPKLSSVPLLSLVNFSLLGAFAFALACRVTVDRPAGSRSVRAILARAVAGGVLTPALLVVPSAWMLYLDLADRPNRTWVAVGLYATAAFFAAVALWALRPAPRERPSEDLRRAADLRPSDRYLDRYTTAFGAIYVLVLALLWLYALPEHLASRGGDTARGTPVGSLSWVLACFTVAPYLLVATHTSKADHV